MGTSTSLLAINWQAWTALATTVYAIFAGLALLGVFFVWKQLKATNRARRLEALNQIYAELHSAQAKADRAAIYASSLDDFSESDLKQLADLREWRTVKLESVERTADMWHHVGLLADKRLIERDVLFKYFAWPLLTSYKKMTPYVAWVRSHRNPDYAEYFRTLASDFEKRYKKAHREDGFLRDFGASTLKDHG